jgi:hypothetical protein
VIEKPKARAKSKRSYFTTPRANTLACAHPVLT